MRAVHLIAVTLLLLPAVATADDSTELAKRYGTTMVKRK